MDNPIEHYQEEKSSATRAKHELLLRYLKMWVGMVVHASKSGDSIIYLDTCAGTGLFPAKSEDFFDAAGSPLIGLNVLSQVLTDERFDKTGRKFHALLYEKDKIVFNELKNNLKSSDFPANLYSIYNADYLESLDSILDCISDSWVLAFIDPFNIGPLPFNKLKALLQAGRTDALIFFPAMQVQRYQGHIKSDAGLEKMTENLSIFFGDNQWIDCIKDVKDGNKALSILANYYMKKINRLGKHCAQFNFLYPTQQKTLYKIIIATKSTEAILQVKKLIFEIREYQNYLRNYYKGIPKSLFKEDVIEEYPIDETAKELYNEFKGQIITGEKIYYWAAFKANPMVFKSTVKKAMTKLLKEKKIENPDKSNFKSRSIITFK